MPPILSSRAYIKRVWRVPKDRGPVECFATLCCKTLVKHGWPARWYIPVGALFDVFRIEYHPEKGLPCPLFWAAVETAVRIQARVYSVDVTNVDGYVTFQNAYTVNDRGQFRKYHDSTRYCKTPRD